MRRCISIISDFATDYTPVMLILLPRSTLGILGPTSVAFLSAFSPNQRLWQRIVSNDIVIHIAVASQLLRCEILAIAQALEVKFTSYTFLSPILHSC